MKDSNNRTSIVCIQKQMRRRGAQMSLNAFVYIATSLGKRGINTEFRGDSFAEKIQKQSSSKKATKLLSRLLLFFRQK